MAFLTLELQMLRAALWVLGIKTLSSPRAAGANCQGISPAPTMYLLDEIFTAQEYEAGATRLA